MNCTYRSIWNDTTGTLVAVSKNAKSAGKKVSSGTSATGVGARLTLHALAISVALSFGANVYALPAGGIVAAGAASISTGAGSTVINQSTQNAALNWQSFNIVAGDGLLNVAVNAGAVKALVQNGGLIRADGGQVLLTAQAAGSLLQSAVNNTGVIQAQTLQNHNGTIKLMGDMQSGTVNVAGKLDASAPNLSLIHISEPT